MITPLASGQEGSLGESEKRGEGDLREETTLSIPLFAKKICSSKIFLDK